MGGIIQKFFVLFFLTTVELSTARSSELTWLEQKGKHFIIEYVSSDDSLWAGEVLNRAENYYESIGRQLGFARYDNFWTWDARTRIFIFPDQEMFIKETKQPAWSNGVALRDRVLVEKKAIVTFKQEDGFFNGVLPHEIAHLVLRDFVGVDKEIPQWFDEGMAQLQEDQKKSEARRLMKGLAKNGNFIPLPQLVTLNIRQEKDSQKAAIFYLESISILDFLIQEYGSDAFAQLCHEMKDGKNFEDALRASYSSVAGSLTELEEKWLKFLNSH